MLRVSLGVLAFARMTNITPSFLRRQEPHSSNSGIYVNLKLGKIPAVQYYDSISGNMNIMLIVWFSKKLDRRL